MRTSLSEVEQLDHWLLQRGEIQERLVTEAKVLCSSEMQEKAHAQSIAYELVELYGREKLCKEIKAVEFRLFHTPGYRSFQQRIQSIFKP